MKIPKLKPRLKMAAPDAVSETSRIGAFGRILLYAGRRFLADGGLRTAAALSYSSLLALVPLFAISLAILSAFDVFERERVDLQFLLFENLPADVGLAVSEQFATFLNNTSQMTATGIASLAVIAILLLNTITGGLNDIWRVSVPRSLAVRLLVYWALLTLGPLLLGASLSLSSYAFAAVQWSGVEDYTPPFIRTRILPVLFSVLGFALMFMLVPNRAVRVAHAVLGAVAATILLELLKAGFGAYLRNFPTYQVIYGALAAIPIFLVWMYLSWAVVLFGAELAASLPEWRAAGLRRRRGGEPGAELALALSLLTRLRDAAHDGRHLRESELARGLPATLGELDHVLAVLRQDRYVARSGRHWILARDLSAVSLDELITALGHSLDPGGGWPAQVSPLLLDLSATGADMRRQSLEDLLRRSREAPQEAAAS